MLCVCASVGVAFTRVCTLPVTRLRKEMERKGTPFRAPSSFFVAKKRKGGLSSSRLLHHDQTHEVVKENLKSHVTDLARSPCVDFAGVYDFSGVFSERKTDNQLYRPVISRVRVESPKQKR